MPATALFLFVGSLRSHEVVARGDLAIAERELRRSLAMRPDVEMDVQGGANEEAAVTSSLQVSPRKTSMRRSRRSPKD